MQSIALQHRDEIIERLRSGHKLIDIAKSLGYKDHSAIVHRLKDDPEYDSAREHGAEARMDFREEQMEQAEDSVTVARARELLSHSRWRAEREFPHRWGQKQYVQPASPVIVNIDLSHSVAQTPMLVEGERE